MEERPRSLLNLRWYAPILALYLVGLLYLGLALRPELGFPLDDSWIHQEIARNLVQHHSFGFTPGVTSSGSSSTLWTLILSLHYLLFPTRSPILFPLLLNSILIAASGLLLWRMAVLDRLPLGESLALALLPALSGNYLWLAFIGMEHVLFVTLSLAAILLWYRPKPQPGEPRPDARALRSTILAGLTLGALGMTRPEGLALSLLLFVLYRWCGRTLYDVLRAAVVAVLFLIPSFLINLKTSGTLLPMTVRGRRFLFSDTDTLHIGRSTVRGLTMETYAKVVQHNFFHTTHAWALIGVALAAYGSFVLLRRFPNRTAILVLWAILHYASYCFTLPATGHGGRYQPFVLVLFPSLIGIALLHLAELIARALPARRRPPALVLQALTLAVTGLLTARTLPPWQAALRDSIYDIRNCHMAMAAYLDAHYPPGTKVGVFDIGAIGYFSHIDLIDLGGLVDRNYLPYLLSGRVPEYLEQRDVHYIVIAHNGPEGAYDGTGDPERFGVQLHFLYNPNVRMQEIHTEGIDYPTWFSSYAYTQHAYRLQTLYRIDYIHPAASHATATP
ncbi:MAG: hypothetical protein M3O02_00950 [Acidobacteriota bacterium]|nr:hypothetical protein [Acidobacteriota bacterium]